MEKLKAVILFAVSIILLCIDIEFKSILTAVFYYGHVLAILLYSIYLITVYRNSKL